MAAKAISIKRMMAAGVSEGGEAGEKSKSIYAKCVQAVSQSVSQSAWPTAASSGYQSTL